MTDRGLELRQLGALALELCEAGRYDDERLINDCLAAGTWDIPAPPWVLKKLRELWESSKASKREWTDCHTARTATAGTSRTSTATEKSVH